MSLTPNYNFKAIKEAIRKSRENIERYVVLGILEIAEESVNIARTLDTYEDQSGNLRNSIGYALYFKNKVVQENFKATVIGTDNNKGLIHAKELAKNSIPDSSNSIQLIVIAGANYAYYVETKGFDVLTSSYLEAEKEIPKMLKELKKQIDSNGR